MKRLFSRSLFPAPALVLGLCLALGLCLLSAAPAPAQSKPGQSPPAPAPVERALDGDNATAPPPITEVRPQLTVRDLSGLPLPKDLTAIFSQKNLARMYEEYKEVIWAVLVLAGLQTFIILALWVNVAGRRKAQEALEQAREELESRVEERVQDISGECDGLRGAIRDRDRAERELKDTAEVLKSILRSIPAGVMIVDPETGTVADLNPTALSLCRARREEVVGQDVRLFLPQVEGRPEPSPESGAAAVAGVLAARDGARLPVARTRAVIELSGRAHILEAFMDAGGLPLVPEAPEAAEPAASHGAPAPDKGGRHGSEPEPFEPFGGSRSGGFGPRDF